MKKEKENQDEICHTGSRQKSKIFGHSKSNISNDFESCGCSANYIWLGIAVIFIVMAAAMIFGK